MFIRRKGRSGAQVDVSVAAEATARNVAIAAARNTLDILDQSDDFTSGSLSNGSLGALGWYSALGAVAVPSGEAGHPGILRKSTSATISQYSTVYLQLSATGPIFPADFFDMTWEVRLNQVDANTTARIGMGANCNSNPPNNGIYVERLDADTNWFFVTRGVSSSTRADTGIAAATGWIKFRLRRVDASTIGCTVNAGAEILATLTIPVLALTPFAALINSAAADKTIDLDAFRLIVTGLAR